MGKHKGLYNYNADESGALALGQLGFDVITGTGNAGTTGDKSGDTVYVAFKVLMTDTGDSTSHEVVITAESLHGDDLDCCLVHGDMIWGCFNYINLTTNSSGLTVIAYRG